ncbi:hypothetical protein NGB30_01860 [Mammaliicoccus fleurettii]|uniref:hypothetical protein n=1 Tax=Mammaliicoccus fleurettii TaxID=150056 RepID=UPI002DB93059|nr:hypothetical protein [Mammaliicoccus fleurettii]MEB7779277.1 hypothetical protein [Mammaliicoccus fleurettii]
MDKGSIFIAIVKFSRDHKPPKARQFIIINKNECLDFLETEKVPGKHKFTSPKIKETKKRYHILTNKESIENGFKYKTAINCSEVFKCDYFSEINILKNRDISNDQLIKIQEKVRSVIAAGLNEPIVNIKISELKSLNRKLSI